MALWRKRTPETALVTPAMFTPASIPGLAWWFDSTTGYAEVDSAFLSPLDISNPGSWTIFNASAGTPSSYTEGAVGVALYGVSQSAAQLQAIPNQPYTIRIDYRYTGNPNGRYVVVAAGNGGEQAYLDLATNTIMQTVGMFVGAGATLVNGVFTVTASSALGPNMYLLTWDGGAFALTHAGNGVRFFEVQGAQVSFVQRKVANWYNQASEIPFPSVAQAVNAQRPIIIQAATPNARQAFNWSRAAQSTMVSAAYVLNQPTTVVCFCNLTANPIITSYYIADGLANDTRVLYHGVVPPPSLIGYAGANLVDAASINGWVMCATVLNGAASIVRQGGVSTLGNAGAGGATGLNIGNRGAANNIGFQGYIASHMGWYRALTTPELDLLQAYCATL